MKWVRWGLLAAGSAVVGWLFCFISALVVFRKFQPVLEDLEVPEEDGWISDEPCL